MARTLRCIPVLLCMGLLVGGCGDASTDDGVAPAAEFLIGGSPLIIFLNPIEPGVELTVGVTRGLTRVRTEDKFKVRTTVEFKGFGTVGPQDLSLAGVKDDGVRGGGEVALDVCVQIPAPLWDALVSAGTVEAKATVELVMRDGAGKEHVLDSKEATTTVDAGDGG